MNRRSRLASVLLALGALPLVAGCGNDTREQALREQVQQAEERAARAEEELRGARATIAQQAASAAASDELPEDDLIDPEAGDYGGDDTQGDELAPPL